MAKLIYAMVLAGLAAFGVSANPAIADKKKYADQTSLRELIQQVENTSFVWFSRKTDQLSAEMIRKFARDFANEKELLAIYPTLGGFAVRMTPEEARQRLEQKGAAFPAVASIESDSLVYGFDSGCEGPQDLPAGQQTPSGIDRVNGKPFSGTARVWIIDSGLASDYDLAELNVVRAPPGPGVCPPDGCSQECTPSGCTSGPADDDKVGHGTMIAGIIAAIDNSEGFVGVAPGAEIIPIKIFKGKKPIINLGTALNAIEYLITKAQPGDVVNISWGAQWDPKKEQHRLLEQALRDLADAGVKIAIAAGNNDTLRGSGYVQTVTPARIGGYEGGTIITVSAVESEESSPGNWVDTFWPDSVFGNGEISKSAPFIQLGPPNFAEPGVNIQSLWPKPSGSPAPGVRSNTCTGTSFAVAHMSGILLHGMPVMDQQAVGDPSANEPVTGVPSDSRQDPIGVCCL